MLTRGRVALAAACAAVLALTPFLLAATAGGASGKRVALLCGQRVATSVVLTADITGCSGYGLVVGANGVTINLNGHTINGHTTTSGRSSRVGVLDPGFSSVTVMNGTVVNFNQGVLIDHGSATIQSLRVTGSGPGPAINALAPAVITGNVVYGNGGNGIIITCCVAAEKATITNNVADGNGGSGIEVGESATGSVVSGNRALSNAADGIDVGAAGATVTGNTANANGEQGMVLVTADAQATLTATGNQAFFNTQSGIILGAGDTDGGGNKADGNGLLHQCENIICS